MKKKSWYSIENGKSVIEIHVDLLQQLFDERDPAPFRLKDLDDDAVEYIVSSAQEIGIGKIGKLRVVTFDLLDPNDSKIIENAIMDYFQYRADISNKKLHSTLKVGFKSLFIGLAFLASAVFLSKSLGSYLPDDFWGHFVKEGFLLLGWVSMWKPVNIFLYEWWPLEELIRLYRFLAKIEVQIVHVERNERDFWPFKRNNIV